MKNLIVVSLALLSATSAFGQRVEVVKLSAKSATNTVVATPVAPTTPPTTQAPVATPVAPQEIAVPPTGDNINTAAELSAPPPSKATGPNKFWSKVGNFLSGGRTPEETLNYTFLGQQGVGASRFYRRLPYETREYESRGTHSSGQAGFFGESYSRGSHHVYQRESRPAFAGLPEYVAPTSYIRVESSSSRTYPVHRGETSGSSTTTVRLR
jgi:hypothetical protein